MIDNDNDNGETRRELIGVYSPAVVLIAWAVIAAIWGFDHVGINVVMMGLTALAAIIAETIRRRQRRQLRQQRRRQREHATGPIANNS